jgi:pyruvate dehydrogenase E1 component
MSWAVGEAAATQGDMTASETRGLLIGGTDGHELVIASTIPACVAYHPTFSHELATIVQDGLRRMLAEREDVFYYLSVRNESYEEDPGLPAGAEEGILRGMYLLTEGTRRRTTRRVQLLGSGTILREVLAAAELLEADHGVGADVWSVTSFSELGRDGARADRWNLLHPTEEPRRAYVELCLDGRSGPVVAATDYLPAVAEQIRPYVPGPYRVLGTDNRHLVAVAALKALADDGIVEPATVRDAIVTYSIETERPARPRVPGEAP